MLCSLWLCSFKMDLSGPAVNQVSSILFRISQLLCTTSLAVQSVICVKLKLCCYSNCMAIRYRQFILMGLAGEMNKYS